MIAPFLGDENTSRFVSYAALHAAGTDAKPSAADLTWGDAITAPTTPEPYARAREALAELGLNPLMVEAFRDRATPT